MVSDVENRKPSLEASTSISKRSVAWGRQGTSLCPSEKSSS